MADSKKLSFTLVSSPKQHLPKHMHHSVYTFNHSYSEESIGINVQSSQSATTSRRLTLVLSLLFLFFPLDVSKNEPYFWIDDMFVTGVLASKVPHEIKIYNWKNSFLSDHRSVLSTKMTQSLYSYCDF